LLADEGFAAHGGLGFGLFLEAVGEFLLLFVRVADAGGGLLVFSLIVLPRGAA
jgi:hypothetical protein